jgi:phenylalanyl-tRNA synthetase beta chain
MKLSREWLSDYTSVTVTDKQFCDAMTMSGSKVEALTHTGDGISRVVAGRTTFMKPHPDSDHLWVFKVDAGQARELNIVTGAQNVSVGDMVPVALDGATLPGGKTIRTSKLRGVVSEGMFCSLGELGLDTRDYPYAIEDGIFVLREPCEPGDDIKTVLGLGDAVVEFEITNNRPDCLSVIGLAREAAATFGTELQIPEPMVSGSGDDIGRYLSVQIQEPALCPRYTARMVKNIKIGPSPAWLRRRLRASGIRPVNNIVDITNYVMQEYGQPMHAFDFSCVHGGRITVRRAAAGEDLATLDGNNRRLTPDMLVIADDEGPIGIAGVMGGGNSEIMPETRTIVFESANFNGTSIRKTAIALGLRTDASGKFEKGLDPEGTVPAVQRACELVELLDAGEVVDGMIDVVAAPAVSRSVRLEPENINRLLGTDIDRDFMVAVLEKLGFAVEGDAIAVPSWRSDIARTADIAEEVARFYGYDVIQPTMFHGATAQGYFTGKQIFERGLGVQCRAMGFDEILTYSFGSRSVWDKMRLGADSPLRDAFVIQNPLGEDTSVMRTTPMPSMLQTLALNQSRRNTAAKLYELETVYPPAGDGPLADEYLWLTLGEYGEGCDFFQLKGCVEAVLRANRIENVGFVAESGDASFHPGRCARIMADGELLGTIGQIHPVVCRNFDLTGEVYYAQLDERLMRSLQAPESTYTPLPRFPALTRDIAIVCSKNVTAAQLSDTICAAGGQYLEACTLFDVYTGDPIPAGRKSVAFSLTLRAADQTLTDDHADECVADILAALKARWDAEIR